MPVPAVSLGPTVGGGLGREGHPHNPALFPQVRKVLKLLETPYHRDTEAPEVLDATEPEGAGGAGGEAGGRGSYSSKPPLWAAELCVT